MIRQPLPFLSPYGNDLIVSVKGTCWHRNPAKPSATHPTKTSNSRNHKDTKNWARRMPTDPSAVLHSTSDTLVPGLEPNDSFQALRSTLPLLVVFFLLCFFFWWGWGGDVSGIGLKQCRKPVVHGPVQDATGAANVLLQMPSPCTTSQLS